MLVDDDVERAAAVEQSLLRSGAAVLSIITDTSALLYQIEQQQPDVVLIDLSVPGRDILESLAVVNAHNPTAMVMFSGDNDPAYIQRAFAAGISTYQLEGINPDKVKPLIDLALAQFRTFQSIRNELHDARTQLEEQRVINKAKNLLMQHQKLDEKTAHSKLTRMAMDNNLKLRDVAKTVITTLGMFEHGEES